ncbi:MAG: pseudouridine synthase [Candidatus Margulisbacteria bacterium]|nr:pseudouridine synthase [Candidatus Margulisiibacteriota bacterium]
MKYLLFNKPYGVLCQFTDQEGRPTLKDFIPVPNVYAVGRLDFDSEGLLLLTDDGALNHRLADPKYKQQKTYWVQVEGLPTEAALEKLRGGVLIQGKRTLPAQVRMLPDDQGLWPRPKPIRFRKSIPTSWLEIKIQEGRNHQVKKMTAAAGLPCLRLVRVGIGPLKLGNLQPGEYAFIKRPLLNG